MLARGAKQKVDLRSYPLFEGNDHVSHNNGAETSYSFASLFFGSRLHFEEETLGRNEE